MLLRRDVPRHQEAERGRCLGRARDGYPTARPRKGPDFNGGRAQARAGDADAQVAWEADQGGRESARRRQAVWEQWHSRAATELSDEMDVDALSQLEAARDLFHITTTLITVLDEDVEADAQMLSVAEARVTFWMHAAGELADYDEVDIPTVLDRLMALAARSVMDKVPTLRWAEERPPPPPQPPPL
jgi:hypothetical protein